MTNTDERVGEIVEEFAERLESTDFGGNIGCYVLVVKDSNDSNSGVPLEIEKNWLHTTLLSYGAECEAKGREEAEEEIKRLRNFLQSIRGEACPESCIFCQEIRSRCNAALTHLTTPREDNNKEV